MNLVIDTNVLVESITSRSPYHKILWMKMIISLSTVQFAEIVILL